MKEQCKRLFGDVDSEVVGEPYLLTLRFRCNVDKIWPVTACIVELLREHRHNAASLVLLGIYECRKHPKVDTI